MDVMMPIMSGFDASQIIRNDPATKHIPIIVFTARGTFREFFAGIPGIEILTKTAGADAVIARVEALIGKPPPSVGELKRAVLLGVDNIAVEKVRALLKNFQYEVFPALNESEAVRMTEKLKPALILCQLWEDSSILDAPKIAQDMAQNPAIARVPFYVYCKEALSVEAMKHFPLGNIITYKENSDLLKKLEIILLQIKNNPA
jgi:CheY-like chemotaxis protein